MIWILKRLFPSDQRQTKQQEIIDLDSFNDVSLFQMIPSGSGMGLSHLKTIVDIAISGNTVVWGDGVNRQENRWRVKTSGLCCGRSGICIKFND